MRCIARRRGSWNFFRFTLSEYRTVHKIWKMIEAWSTLIIPVVYRHPYRYVQLSPLFGFIRLSSTSTYAQQRSSESNFLWSQWISVSPRFRAHWWFPASRLYSHSVHTFSFLNKGAVCSEVDGCLERQKRIDLFSVTLKVTLNTLRFQGKVSGVVGLLLSSHSHPSAK